MKIGAIADRVFQFDRAKADKKERTIPVSFSSETPVLREFGYEILDHGKGAADLSRAPLSLVVEHDGRDLVGVVEGVQIGADRKGRGVARFGTSARANEIWDDVLAGIRTNLSIRYTVTDSKPEGKAKDGIPIHRATRWQAIHVSFVSDPADPSVGVHRSIQMKNLDHNPADGGGGTRTDDAAEIEAIAARFEQRVPGLRDAANRALLAGTSAKEFRERASAMYNQIKPATVITPTTDGCAIGLSDRDLNRYSFRKLILEQADGKLSGLELEAHQEAQRKQGTRAKGAMIPWDVLTYQRDMPRTSQRDLLAGNFVSAGALVDDDFRADAFIELLRNRMFTAAAGVRTLTGLQGPVVIPKHTAAGSVYWVAEDAEVTETNQTTGQLTMVIHALSAHTDYSKELLIQSSLDIENFIKRDLAETQAIEIDRVIIDGDGTSGEPLGILNTTGLSTAVTFGGAATYAKMIEFETNVASSNADMGSLAYMTTPATRGKLRAKSVDTGSGVFVWGLDNKVVGHNAFATKQVPSDKVIYGNWNDVLLGIWGGLDVVTDIFTQAKKRLVGVTVSQFVDVAIRNPTSFSISSDSGAQ